MNFWCSFYRSRGLIHVLGCYMRDPMWTTAVLLQGEQSSLLLLSELTLAGCFLFYAPFAAKIVGIPYREFRQAHTEVVD